MRGVAKLRKQGLYALALMSILWALTAHGGTTAPTDCGDCHGEQVQAVFRSPHSTLAGIINQTRYLWGAQDSVLPHVFSANNALRPLPQPIPTPRSPAMLVDDFLRSECLHCHLGSPGKDGRRPTGCAACHSLEGTTSCGLPEATPKTADEHATRVAAADDSACLECHQENHVGADFHGVFQGEIYGNQRQTSPVIQLTQDIHASRGLGCLDCHSGAEVMGQGGRAPSCTACHGGYTGEPPDPTRRGVRLQNGTAMFDARDGRTRVLPRISTDTAGHDEMLHSRLRCSACHAQWAFGEYGLSVMRLDAPTHDPRTARALRSPQKKTRWLVGWRFRRWEQLPLGVDARGRISVLRPKNQYLVSFTNSLGRVVLESVIPQRGDSSGPGWAFLPYEPHTTGAKGRLCSSCHENQEATGLAPAWAVPPDLVLFEATPPTPGNGQLLTTKDAERLLHSSQDFRRRFAAYLSRLLEKNRCCVEQP
ncbi:cytochrome c3 family protein [Desulfovibrio ferrophilus]|uniref:Uncharacterized protein n=1 Tax=Desulfovibrio ferrophilus TaxID=241368 RepID=A0A2Z6AZ63_9BACT|nr:cytochrome c3 family protein [Desulfovibrio ferrophilus]BBD08483.1 uncharacterized protein DFE_1757 [Desulfovibrio ferrophilus]